MIQLMGQLTGNDNSMLSSQPQVPIDPFDLDGQRRIAEHIRLGAISLISLISD